jgi:glycosyltransferase involved in cell wall biosynthesis
MRIALDATPLTVQKSGIGEYTYQLAVHLALRYPQDDFLLVSNFPFAPIKGPANLKFKACATNWISGRWWLVGLPRLLEQEGVDVFHGTDYSVPLIPLRPSLVTVHDLSSVRWRHLHERRTRRTSRRLGWMVRIATHVITHTETVCEEIRQQYGLPGEKVTGIPLAPGPQFHAAPGDDDDAIRKNYGLHQPYVLFVGTLEPRKNLVTLIRAFTGLPPRILAETQLAICGRWGWKNEALQTEIEKLQPKNWLRITGYVPDEHLPTLYRGAAVLAYPSLYEGFGLPPLEAMASGVPVIASGVPAVAEVLGDAALLVSPLDVEGWKRGLQGLLAGPETRQTYIHRGRLHAGKFSWERSAERTYSLYQKVLSEFRPGNWERVWRTMLNWVPEAR